MDQEVITWLLRPKKSNVTATIKNRCKLTVTNKQIINDCKITSSSSLLGSLFHYGTNTIDCSRGSDQLINCSITITGKPQAIRNLFVKRTSQRLAVSGSAHTLRTLYRAQYYTINGSDNGAKDSHYKNAVNPIWSKMISKMKKQQQYNGSFTLKSTRGSYDFKAN